jgi:hypothetical protein
VRAAIGAMVSDASRSRLIDDLCLSDAEERVEWSPIQGKSCDAGAAPRRDWHREVLDQEDQPSNLALIRRTATITRKASEVPRMIDPLTLKDSAADFANPLKSVDADGRAFKNYSPGVGPYGEREAIEAALPKLRKNKSSRYADAALEYSDAGIKNLDLLIPSQWAVEFKMVRPYKNNGTIFEHWSENALHPYEGNTSALGDCLKLLSSGVSERKAVLIFGCERTPPTVKLDAAIRGFEVLAREVMNLRLTPRVEQLRDSLIHPVHQQLRVFAYEVLGTLDTRSLPQQETRGDEARVQVCC